ncbi:hypothetical protein [Thalassovita aquimarina]|uniref:Uncharacterized protein n=1 Tax=Thalassovita aquimarina TaxID=2785917 RepID=A0ABS5HVI2_9RHOB|nr:hypothetical protein [Thalassovita aquimarina]MBR9652974.1 hypothetical protein [Thalassovita aquimarina]
MLKLAVDIGSNLACDFGSAFSCQSILVAMKRQAAPRWTHMNFGPLVVKTCGGLMAGQPFWLVRKARAIPIIHRATFL